MYVARRCHCISALDASFNLPLAFYLLSILANFNTFAFPPDAYLAAYGAIPASPEDNEDAEDGFGDGGGCGCAQGGLRALTTKVGAGV